MKAISITAAVSLVLIVLTLFAPSPYVLEAPGPIFNTLGKQDGKPLIQIQGAPSYPTTGELNLVTVLVGGGPNGQIGALDSLRGWLDKTLTVVPADFLYPPTVTSEQVQQENQADMTSSQELAVAAALRYLGKPVKEVLNVTQVVPDAPAQGVLQNDDVLLAFDGKPIESLDQLRESLNKAGGAPAKLEIQRKNQDMDVSLTPAKGESGNYQLGVQLAQKFDFPFQVTIGLNDVGGPSAGTMFALGIIDKLTEQNMTGGKNFAGTGTIAADGTVGPIGGIAQKMVGAQRGGARYFLAPESNCNEVRGHIPSGLSVVKISTLSEAVDVVTKIGRRVDPSTLPQC